MKHDPWTILITTLSFLAVVAPAALRADSFTTREQMTLDRILEGKAPEYTADLVVDDAVPLHVRRFTEFSGDVSGRYIEAISLATADGETTTPLLNDIVTSVIACQKPDGHWGDPFSTGTIKNSNMSILWGNGRLLIGLLANYRLTHRADVLDAATRLGNFFLSVAPRMNSQQVENEFNQAHAAVGYICWTQTIEGLVELGRLTKNPSFTSLAEQIAARTRIFPSQHSHGLLSSLRGILDLYSFTHNSRYLKTVEDQCDSLAKSGNILLQGGVPELLKPSMQRDEGCSEADWVRLNLQLWNLTQNTTYLQRADRCLFNEFSFNQFADGDFGNHHFTSTGAAPPATLAWRCCTFHGLRALQAVTDDAFHFSTGTLTYNLPVDARITTVWLDFIARSSLSHDASVAITVASSLGHVIPKTLDLQIPVPGWAEQISVKLNDQLITPSRKKSFLVITRAWAPGDHLALHYKMRLRTLKNDDGTISFFYGPWLLGADDQASPRFFGEESRHNTLDLNTSTSLPSPDTISSDTISSANPLAVPIAHVHIKYHPGGYPNQPQALLLRPIAEQTLSDDRTTWQFRFR